MTASVPAEFWTALEALVESSRLVIDRPKGSRHPRFPSVVYPVDYGYLEGTAAIDGNGVDAWRGTAGDGRIAAAICTVDLMKKDTEVKILIGCSAAEIAAVEAFCNGSPYMKGALIRR